MVHRWKCGTSVTQERGNYTQVLVLYRLFVAAQRRIWKSAVHVLVQLSTKCWEDTTVGKWDSAGLKEVVYMGKLLLLGRYSAGTVAQLELFIQDEKMRYSLSNCLHQVQLSWEQFLCRKLFSTWIAKYTATCTAGNLFTRATCSLPVHYSNWFSNYLTSKVQTSKHAAT